ncbi:hypothetical protein SESBI_14826 [Sesbania bispinosa]|nr:hypothetical protein SESBI_14826 [Sesbania bispinosa]
MVVVGSGELQHTGAANGRSGAEGRAEAGEESMQRTGATSCTANDRRTGAAAGAEGRTEAGEERCWWSLVRGWGSIKTQSHN